MKNFSICKREAKRHRKYYLTLVISFILLLFMFGHFQSSKFLSKKFETVEEKPPQWSLSPLWSEDGQTHINPHPYRFLNNQPDLCESKKSINLLILVSSAVSHREHRDAIRSTWGSKSFLDAYNAKMVFLLGQGKDKQSEVNDESKIYSDIIQEDFHDIYHNLTLKTIMGLKWSAIFCSDAKYVMKTDDDIFVNVPLLIQALNYQYQDDKKILGCAKNGKGSPQPIPAQHPSGQQMAFTPGHPEFTAGAGYVIPGKFVADLYLASLSTKFIPVEDAFTTGYCARKVGLHPPHHDPRFSCGQIVSNDCDMKTMFTGHKIDPERQYSIFDKIHQSLHLCRARVEP